MNIKHQFVITITDDGKLQISGTMPLSDTMTIYGMLGCARDAVVQANAEPSRIAVTPASALSRVASQGG